MRRRTPSWYRIACVVGVALATAVGSAACGGGGSGKKRPRQVILRSEDVDRKVGQDVAQEVDAQLGLIHDPRLVAYVAELGNRLAPIQLI